MITSNSYGKYILNIKGSNVFVVLAERDGRERQSFYLVCQASSKYPIYCLREKLVISVVNKGVRKVNQTIKKSDVEEKVPFNPT